MEYYKLYLYIFNRSFFMKIGIVGSRKRNTIQDKQLIEQYLKNVTISEIVSGGCKQGADKFAEEISVEQNIPIKLFLPELKNVKYYYEATEKYYKRNKQIAEYCDILIALVSKDRKGGTENTIKYAKQLNKKIILL